MQSPLVLVLAVVVGLCAHTACGFQDDPPDTEYYVKNMANQFYLYVDKQVYPASPGHAGLAVVRNLYAWNVADALPMEPAAFYVRKNEALGPYYNLIHIATNTTVYGSELQVGPVQNLSAVATVLAWKDADHLDTPEATWNIRRFQGNVYILNHALGAYLYAGRETTPPLQVDAERRLMTLLPTETGGRDVVGTQWDIINKKTLLTRMGADLAYGQSEQVGKEEEEKKKVGGGEETKKEGEGLEKVGKKEDEKKTKGNEAVRTLKVGEGEGEQVKGDKEEEMKIESDVKKDVVEKEKMEEIKELEEEDKREEAKEAKEVDDGN